MDSKHPQPSKQSQIPKYKRDALLRLVFFHNHKIKEAAKELSIKYTAAKTIVSQFRRNQRGAKIRYANADEQSCKARDVIPNFTPDLHYVIESTVAGERNAELSYTPFESDMLSLFTQKKHSITPAATFMPIMGTGLTTNLNISHDALRIEPASKEQHQGFQRVKQINIPELKVHGIDDARSFWSNLKATRAMLTSASERLALLRKSLYQELATEENLDDNVVKILLEDMKKRDKSNSIRSVEKTTA